MSDKRKHTITVDGVTKKKKADDEQGSTTERPSSGSVGIGLSNVTNPSLGPKPEKKKENEK